MLRVGIEGVLPLTVLGRTAGETRLLPYYIPASDKKNRPCRNTLTKLLLVSYGWRSEGGSKREDRVSKNTEWTSGGVLLGGMLIRGGTLSCNEGEEKEVEEKKEKENEWKKKEEEEKEGKYLTQINQVAGGRRRKRW